MAENTIGNMFGVDPQAMAQARQNSVRQQAYQHAQLDPFQQASALTYQGGAGLVDAGMMMAGRRPAAEEQAERRNSYVAGVDMNNPEQVNQAAMKANQAGDSQAASILSQHARALKVEAEKSALATRKQDFTENAKFQSDRELKLMGLENQRLQIEGTLASKQLSAEQTAEYRAALLGIRQQMVSIQQGKASVSKPKGLTREASLKWDLDNELIDQATYDQSISATPGAKLKDERVASAKLTELGLKSIEDNIAKLYDPKTGKILPAVMPLFGKYDQYRPEWAMSQEGVDANTALESLTNQVMMGNLADAKERVGQSFGSMQVQEWDKFTQQLTSLKRGLSPDAAAEAMKYVTNFIATKRDILNTALAANPSTANARAGTGGRTVVREVKLKDGKIGVEYSDGTRGYK